MAKITRQTFIPFGRDGGTSNFGQFGSQAASAPITSKSIATIQALSAWTQGWQNAVAIGEAPYLQDMNGVMYVLGYEQAYTLQAGVAEWDAGTTYYTGSLVNDGVGNTYASLVDTNLNNALPTAPSSNGNWQFIVGPTKIGEVDLISSQAASNSAAIQFTGLNGGIYSKYVLVIADFLPATGAAALKMQMSTGSGFIVAGYSDQQQRMTTVGQAFTGSLSVAFWTLSPYTDLLSNSQGSAWEVTVFNPSSTQALKRMQYQGQVANNAGVSETVMGSGIGSFNSAAIDGIKLFMSSGNITSGTFFLYGYRNG